MSSDKVVCLFVAFMEEVYRSKIKTMNSKTIRYMSIYNNIKEKRENFPEKFVLGDCTKSLVINAAVCCIFFGHC